MNRRPPSKYLWGTALAALAILGWLGWSVGRAQQAVAVAVAAADAGRPGTNPPAVYPVQIRALAGAPRVITGRTGADGAAVTVACSACHTTTTPNLETRRTTELNEFHQGLQVQHGDLACLSCHNAENYDTLRLATGQPLEFERVMTLCGQCHGTARRDYERGSHGGMTGYWDLSKGPRTRNHCVNCHDPHVPKYPQAMPVFAPRDRLAVGRPAKGDH